MEDAAILKTLPGCDWAEGRVDAPPLALRNLKATEDERRAAFTPELVTLPVSDVLFDAWALTTVRGKLPGRPHVEPYLHGIAEWEPPETYVAWRDEVELIPGDLLAEYKPEDLLEDYPLKPHELLRDRSYRVFEELQTIAKRKRDAPVPIWLVDEDDAVEITTLGSLTRKEQIAARLGLTIPRTSQLLRLAPRTPDRV